MLDSGVRHVVARQIFDSRGRPTLEADVELADGSFGRAAVPSGASTGQHEAHELRDGDAAAYGGLGVLQAVANVDDVLGPAILGLDARMQSALDARMREVDASPNLARLGANAVLGVSMAACRAAAAQAHLPLYRHLAVLAGVEAPRLPLPMVNVLSGGAHARGGMDVQDFLVIPIGASTLDDALLMAARVRTAAGRLLVEQGGVLLLADEGGFAPGYATVDEALDLMVRAMVAAGLQPGVDVGIGMDVAATQFVRSDGGYELRREGATLTSDRMIARTIDWLDRYPVVSIEDPLGEDDWPAWQRLTHAIGARCQLVGDDLFCTNPERIARGVEAKVANAVLIKLNQIGTVSDTLAALALARSAGYRGIVSARSGETEDPFIADLATATAAGQIKIGSLANSERLSKYNQLIRIQEELGTTSFSKNQLK